MKYKAYFLRKMKNKIKKRRMAIALDKVLFFFNQNLLIFFSFLHKKHYIMGSAQDIFLKPLFRGNLDSVVNNANLGAIAHMSNGT